MTDADSNTLRLTVFVALWLLLALAEWLHSAGYRHSATLPRWSRHLGIALLGSVLVSVILPGGAVAAAIWAGSAQVGLFHWLAVGSAAQFVLTLLVFDLATYFKHWAFHYWSLLWRLHAVHHSDTSIDISTAIRFHPVEILLSMLFNMGLSVALGAPPEALVVYAIILNGMALVSHADIRLPPRLERYLRWLIVTPPMHRIHHSDREFETNSNYGNALSVWDRVFGSYRDTPVAELRIGLQRWRGESDQWLRRLLLQPFGRQG